jgi:hypothetical protein
VVAFGREDVVTFIGGPGRRPEDSVSVAPIGPVVDAVWQTTAPSMAR